MSTLAKQIAELTAKLEALQAKLDSETAGRQAGRPRDSKGRFLPKQAGKAGKAGSKQNDSLTTADLVKASKQAGNKPNEQAGNKPGMFNQTSAKHFVIALQSLNVGETVLPQRLSKSNFNSAFSQEGGNWNSSKWIDRFNDTYVIDGKRFAFDNTNGKQGKGRTRSITRVA